MQTDRIFSTDDVFEELIAVTGKGPGIDMCNAIVPFLVILDDQERRSLKARQICFYRKAYTKTFDEK